MISVIENSKAIFNAPTDHFWHWDDNGAVIVFRQVRTICYRDELIGILKAIPAKGLPSLGPILLILAACKEKFSIHEKFFIVRASPESHLMEVTEKIDQALAFLEKVSELPEELRKGDNRIHLLYEVFKDAEIIYSQEQILSAVDELDSGRIDYLIQQPGKQLTQEEFYKELWYLIDAGKRFSTVKDLELRLRTGLDKIPTALKIERDPPQQVNLFDRLLANEKTQFLSHLAKRLISILKIPLHAAGTGDQPIGGISDITNRGNFDKLLLSELAQDDMLLMARLVNNEALYFRREQPPENPRRRRNILLDTTIKMWGLPRVFGLSAALALLYNSTRNEEVKVYALGKTEAKELDFNTDLGIIEALGLQDTSLHSGEALETAVNSATTIQQTETILIIESKLFLTTAFQFHYSKVREKLSFLVLIDREGNIQFLDNRTGKGKILSSARLKLDDLLTVPPPIKSNSSDNNALRPAFFNEFPLPLLSPKIRIKRTVGKQFHIPATGVLTVTETQRLLLLTSDEKGAIELLNAVPRGIYELFWHSHDKLIFLLSKNASTTEVKLFKINLKTSVVHSSNLSEDGAVYATVQLSGYSLEFSTRSGSKVFDCQKMQWSNSPLKEPSIIEEPSLGRIPILDPGASDSVYRSSIGFYSAMYKVKSMYVSVNGVLVIGNYHVFADKDLNSIRIAENKGKFTVYRASTEFDTNRLYISNRGLKFASRKWPDGSLAVIDSRGFLHLKSSNNSIADITIVLVTGTVTACWSSDGYVCGHPYFFPERTYNKIEVIDFYERFIQKFIDNLML